ncbi:MAG: MarR family transcriptional regulator [Rhizobiaceae bacterium]
MAEAAGDLDGTERDDAPAAERSILDAPEYYLASLDRQNRENMNAALRPHGLKVADWRILSCLAHIPALAVSDLAELTVVERSVASRLVDRLIERGLLSKTASEADKRFAEVSLTAEGRAKLREAEAAVADLRDQLFGGLTTEDRENLLRMLRVLRRNALSYRRLAALLP